MPMKHVGRTDKSEINNAGGIQNTALHSELERHRIHPANFRMRNNFV